MGDSLQSGISPRYVTGHPDQFSFLSTLSWVGNEYRPKCGNALWMGSKGCMAHSTRGQTCGRQVKLRDLSLTHAIPEHFRNEYRTHYTNLLLTLLLNVKFHQTENQLSGFKDSGVKICPFLCFGLYNSLHYH